MKEEKGTHAKHDKMRCICKIGKERLKIDHK